MAHDGSPGAGIMSRQRWPLELELIWVFEMGGQECDLSCRINSWLRVLKHAWKWSDIWNNENENKLSKLLEIGIRSYAVGAPGLVFKKRSTLNVFSDILVVWHVMIVSRAQPSDRSHALSQILKARLFLPVLAIQYSRDVRNVLSGATQSRLSSPKEDR